MRAGVLPSKGGATCGEADARYPLARDRLFPHRCDRHPTDEDLSLPPQEAKTTSWGPGRWGPRSRKNKDMVKLGHPAAVSGSGSQGGMNGEKMKLGGGNGASS